MSNYDIFDKQVAEGTATEALKEKMLSKISSTATFSTFYRYVIIDVVFDPTSVDDKKIAYWEHELNVKNIKFAKVLPRNTIIAQRVAEGSATANEEPMFLFPMLPPTIALPAQPGEHVWVMFENKSIKRPDIGYWLCRIVGPGFVEDVNHTHMPRVFDPSFHPSSRALHQGTGKPVYEFKPGKVQLDGGLRTTSFESTTIQSDDEAVYEKLLTEADASKIRTLEAVPRFRKRPSDVVIEGTNNTLISLSQNRKGQAAEYSDSEKGQVPHYSSDDNIGEGSGRIDIVVGRGQTPPTLGPVVQNSLGFNEIGKSTLEVSQQEGDPDLLNDRSRVMLSQSSMIDEELGMVDHNVSFSVENVKAGSVAVKSDKIRIVGRSDVELLVTSFDADDEGRMMSATDVDRWASIIVRADGNIIIKPAEGAVVTVQSESESKFVALENLVKDELQKIRDEHNKFIKNSFNVHTHPHALGPTSPPTQPAQEMGPAGDVAATKLRTV
jgi:hypothetical protein